jgi:hypothetical protein
MKRLRLLGAASVAAAIALMAVVAIGLHSNATSSVEAQPLPPAKFYGTVTVNGQPAALGSAIRAKVDGNVCGSTTVQSIQGVGTNAYNIDVLHSGQQAGCGDPGDTVTFEWASTPTGAEFVVCGTGSWNNTSFNLLNLSCGPGPTTAPPTTAPPTTAPPTTAPPTSPAATTPAATTAAPVAPPPSGGGPGDSSSFGWLPLALAGAALAGVGGVLALRRSAR